MTAAIEFAHADRSLRPQDDLFRFMNGAWLRTARIEHQAQTECNLFKCEHHRQQAQAGQYAQPPPARTDVAHGFRQQHTGGGQMRLQPETQER